MLKKDSENLVVSQNYKKLNLKMYGFLTKLLTEG